MQYNVAISCRNGNGSSETADCTWVPNQHSKRLSTVPQLSIAWTTCGSSKDALRTDVL